MGSSALFTATNHRAYFRHITILLPYTWDLSGESVDRSTDETFSTANFLVDKVNPAYGDTPYVKLSGKCGLAGDYVHLTYEYLGQLGQYSLGGKGW